MTAIYSPKIWTETAYKLMYECIYKRWGRLRKIPNTPEWHHFTTKLAETVEADGPKAVEAQIRFIMPIHSKQHWRNGHRIAALQNLTAALNAGVINSADLPNLVATPN